MGTRNNKLRIIFIMVILIVVLLSCIHIVLVFNHVREEVRDYHTSVADMNIQILKERLQNDTSQLKVLAATLERKQEGFWNTDEARLLIEDFRKNSNFTKVGIANTDGIMYFARGLEPVDVSSQKYFRLGLEGKIAMQSMATEKDGSTVRRLNIGIPIYEENRVDGVLIGSYSIEALNELLPTNLNARVINSFVVRSDGRIIINGTEHKEYQSLRDVWASPHVAISKNNLRIISQSVLNNKRGTVSYYIDDDKHYLISVPVSFSEIYAHVGATRWNLVVDIPSDYIVSEAASLLIENMIYSMSVLVIFLLLSIRFYRQKQREYMRVEIDSRTDTVTGGYNRRALEQEFKKAILNKKNMAVCLVDLDNFKLINDELGHPVGDEVLLKFAKILKKNVRSRKGFSGRLGGDEFLFVLPDVTDIEAKNIAEEISAIFNMEFKEYCENYNLGITIGISCSPKDGEDFYGLLKCADEALYQGKRKGKMKITVTD